MSGKRKVFLLHENLTKQEREKLRKFLFMELSDSASTLLQLYDILSSNAIQQEHHIWDSLFPHKKYNDGLLRKYFYRLSTHIEDFLAYQSFSKNAQDKERHLLSELSKRPSLGSLLPKSFRKIKRQPPKLKDALYHQRQYYLESKFREYLLLVGSSQKQLTENLSRHKDAFEQWMIAELFQFSFSNTLSEICKVAIEAILPSIQNQEAPDEITTLYIQLYRAVYKPEEGGEIQDLMELMYETTSRHKSKEDLINIAIILLNVLIKNSNKTKTTEAYENVRKFYKWMIDEKLVFVEGYLPWQHFHNLLYLKLRRGTPEEATQFIEEYIPLLPKEEQEDAKAYADGILHYHLGQFTEAKKMAFVSFSHLSYEIPARFMALEARYEIGEREDLRMPLDNLIRFIQRQDTISKDRQEGMVNRGKLFRKLVLVYNTQGYEKLLNRIKNTKKVYQPKWLIQKCEDNTTDQ